MQISSLKDTLSILISIITGIIISVIFDIFKAIRKSFKSGQLIIFIQDIIFFLISAIITFTLLFLRVNGEIRWFILFFELIGFTVSQKLFSRYIVKALYNIMIFIKNYVFSPVNAVLNRFYLIFNDFFDKLFLKIKKNPWNWYIYCCIISLKNVRRINNEQKKNKE